MSPVLKIQVVASKIHLASFHKRSLVRVVVQQSLVGGLSKIRLGSCQKHSLVRAVVQQSLMVGSSKIRLASCHTHSLRLVEEQLVAWQVGCSRSRSDEYRGHTSPWNLEGAGT